jgi:hypothetical protein
MLLRESRGIRSTVFGVRRCQIFIQCLKQYSLWESEFCLSNCCVLKGTRCRCRRKVTITAVSSAGYQILPGAMVPNLCKVFLCRQLREGLRW